MPSWPPTSTLTHWRRCCSSHARRRPSRPPRPEPTADPPSLGRLVAVTGPAGVGASTVAQALAAHHTGQARTLLADLALDADQHLRHGVPPGHDGVFELAEALRHAPPADLAPPTTVQDAGYDLLCGLRRRQEWTALTTVVADQIVDVLRRSHPLVVADVLCRSGRSRRERFARPRGAQRPRPGHAAPRRDRRRGRSVDHHRRPSTRPHARRPDPARDRPRPPATRPQRRPEQQGSPGPGLPDDDRDLGRRGLRAMARSELASPTTAASKPASARRGHSPLDSSAGSAVAVGAGR